MNLFVREMKAHWKSLLFWCIGILIMIGSGMAKFSAMNNAANQSMSEMIKQMPKSIQAIFGMSSLDLSKAIGFYGILLLYLDIMAGIHAGIIGANIIAKEERDKTAEFLLVKPMSRTSIINFKLLAALVNILIFNAVTWVTSVLVMSKYSNGEDLNASIAKLMIGMLIFQLIFLGLGTAIGATSRSPKISANIAVIILLVTYLFSVMIDMTDKLDLLKYFTPFKYFDAQQIINMGHYKVEYITISFILIAASIISTYVFYRSRDMSI